MSSPTPSRSSSVSESREQAHHQMIPPLSSQQQPAQAEPHQHDNSGRHPLLTEAEGESGENLQEAVVQLQELLEQKDLQWDELFAQFKGFRSQTDREHAEYRQQTQELEHRVEELVSEAAALRKALFEKEKTEKELRAEVKGLELKREQIEVEKKILLSTLEGTNSSLKIEVERLKEEAASAETDRAEEVGSLRAEISALRAEIDKRDSLVEKDLKLSEKRRYWKGMLADPRRHSWLIEELTNLDRMSAGPSASAGSAARGVAAAVASSSTTTATTAAAPARPAAATHQLQGSTPAVPSAEALSEAPKLGGSSNSTSKPKSSSTSKDSATQTTSAGEEDVEPGATRAPPRPEASAEQVPQDLLHQRQTQETATRQDDSHNYRTRPRTSTRGRGLTSPNKEQLQQASFSPTKNVQCVRRGSYTFRKTSYASPPKPRLIVPTTGGGAAVQWDEAPHVDRWEAPRGVARELAPPVASASATAAARVALAASGGAPRRNVTVGIEDLRKHIAEL